MTINVGINDFKRIGRQVYRATPGYLCGTGSAVYTATPGRSRKGFRRAHFTHTKQEGRSDSC